MFKLRSSLPGGMSIIPSFHVHNRSGHLGEGRWSSLEGFCASLGRASAEPGSSLAVSLRRASRPALRRLRAAGAWLRIGSSMAQHRLSTGSSQAQPGSSQAQPRLSRGSAPGLLDAVSLLLLAAATRLHGAERERVRAAASRNHLHERAEAGGARPRVRAARAKACKGVAGAATGSNFQ